MSIPIIEMHIRAMGEHVIHATALMAEEISARVAAEVNRTVKNFDFESYVRSETEDALRSYMTEGGGHDVVVELANSLGEKALDKILKK